MEIIEKVGFHGTNSDFVESIISDNFRISDAENEWLGRGVYMFVEGVSCPKENAEIWAKNQAFRTGGCYAYDNYTVLEVLVRGSKVLDLGCSSGLKAFNVVRNAIIQKHSKLFTRNREFANDNCVIWNLVADFMELEIIVHHLYIKDKTQRIKKINSNVPNVTVMCVKNAELIDLDSIKVSSTGSVRS